MMKRDVVTRWQLQTSDSLSCEESDTQGTEHTTSDSKATTDVLERRPRRRGLWTVRIVQ